MKIFLGKTVKKKTKKTCSIKNVNESLDIVEKLNSAVKFLATSPGLEDPPWPGPQISVTASVSASPTIPL